MNMFLKKGLFGLIIFCIAFFVVNQILFFESGALERFTTKVTYPVVFVASGVADFIQKRVEGRESYEQIKAELKLLNEKCDQFCEENIKIKALFKFDSDSKEICEFKERYNLDHMMGCKVLLKSLKKDGQFFLINRGSFNGIKKNMVGIYKFQILGKITEVHDYYSKLTLITDEACKVAAFASSTNANGIVIGQNQKNCCKMHYVSHLLDIVDNDMVLSTGRGLVFPEGFCIGKIVNHSHSHNSLYHDIDIEPLIDFKTIKYCLLTDLSQTCSAAKFDMMDNNQTNTDDLLNNPSTSSEPGACNQTSDEKTSENQE
ncbi:MAG: rod shape-determining protein MreC [Candidatus Babeliales bacterium]|nr:MAG: Cell shape-determining protein MreC [candidate division TM6 bacterium GW2011_GWF2_36_6]